MRPGAALIRALTTAAAFTVAVCATAQQDAPAAAAANVAPPAVMVMGGGAYQGRTVHDIQFRGVSGDAAILNQLRELVEQKTGEPLDRRKVRSSIQQLYATGRFANLQAEAEQRPDAQVTLVFVAQPNFFVGFMTMEGAPKRPTAAQLLDSSKLTLGELFTPEKLEAAFASMKQVLADNGYYQAEVTAEKIEHPETQQVELHFHVVPGAPATVGQVTIKGSPGYSPEEVRNLAHLHSGDRVSVDRLTKALQHLRKRYQKEHRLEAQIAVSNRIYRQQSNTLDYVFSVVRGPTVDISVEGAGISQRTLKKLVPVFEEYAVDDDLLNEGRRNLRTYFQTRGYFDTDVTVQRDPQPEQNHVHIVYVVNRGSRHNLSDLRIDVQPAPGRRPYYEADDLRERMQVQPSGILFSHGRFSPDMLARDVRTLEDLFRSQGFQQVKVTTEVEDDYKGEKDRMAVFVHVNEGLQTLVGNLVISGNQSFSRDELPELSTEEGQPFSDASLASDRDSVLNFYFNNGFPDVQFEATSKPEANDSTRMNVTYVIKEGDRVYVDRVLTSGLHYTHPWVVRRDMKVRNGDPLNQENMYLSQAAFYDLGIFNEVNMAVQNPEGRAKYKDIAFQFQEAKRWTFNYGLGLEIQTGTPANAPSGRTGASPRVSFDVNRINFRGREHTLTLHSHVGRLQQRGSISYDAPRWFNVPFLRLTFTTLYDNSLNVQTFSSERFEGAVQAEQTVTRRFDGQPVTTLLWHFNYRRVRASNLNVAVEQIPQLSQPVRLGMPSLTYIRDKRDNPIDARKGNYNTFDGGYASAALGSQLCVPPPSGSAPGTPAPPCTPVSFGRMLVQNATYQPFGRKGRFVFARSTRIGIEELTGQSTVIPLPERFLAGGGTTLRGFGLNQAGPRDLSTGFPVGGAAMFINNLEMRFPPMTLPFFQDSLSLVTFLDSGNVFERATDMFNNLLRWSQKDRNSCRSLDTTTNLPCDLNYISHAVGLGVRYRTPVGPVRVDFGYNLNPPTFPVRKPTDTTDPHFETLGRFNFFFSIGQTF